MVNKNLLIALVFISTFSLSAKSDINDSVYNELNQDASFDSSNYTFDRQCEEHKEFEGVSLIEHESKDLIFYVFNKCEWEILDPDDVRISMSYRINKETVNSFSHYNLKLLDYSSDSKFYKFKLENFAINFNDVNRIYSISELEVKQQRYKNENNEYVGIKISNEYISSVIGQEYSYKTNSQGMYVYNLKNINTLTLDTKSSYYRVPGLNGNSDNLWNRWSDINYLYFYAPKNLGNLIGIKVDFEKCNYKSRFVPQIADDPFTHDYDPTISYVQDNENSSLASEFNEVNYDVNSNYDLNTYSNEIWWNKVFKWCSNGFNVIGSSDVIKDLKVMNKIELSEIASADFTSEKKCLSGTTVDDIKKRVPEMVLNDLYLIRFDVCDFSLTGRADVPAYDLKIPYTGTNTLPIYKLDYFDYKYIDVIQLTYSKNGLVYALPVVSNTESIKKGMETPTNIKLPDWLIILIEIIGIILFLVLGLYLLPYIIKLIVWIIKLPRRIINAFKKK